MENKYYEAPNAEVVVFEEQDILNDSPASMNVGEEHDPYSHRW